MQFILSDDEMQAVNKDREKLHKLPGGADHLLALENVCKHVATTMTAKGKDRPNGCIHVEDPRGQEWKARYCDHCEVAGVCPMPKNWSK